MAGWTWYGVGGWLLALAGVVALLLFVFGRRVVVRRHPRCAACGYRLDGLQTDADPARCPECGRMARPGEAFTLGRKRRVAIVGVALLVAGLLLPSVPTVRAQGWLAALPMGIQVRALPYSDSGAHWGRVLQAGVSQQLTAGQLRRTRAALLDRLASPDGDPTPALEAVLTSGLQRPWSRQAGMDPLTPAELLEAARDGSARTRSFVGRLLQIDTVPTTPEEAALRRAGWRTASQHERVALLQAIAQYPAGVEDLAFIRSAFEADAWSAGLAISRSPVAPSVQALVSELLEHPDPNTRRGAVVACEGWLRDRNAKPPLELQRRLLTIVFSDPEPQVASLAARSIDNFSSELGAEIGESSLR